MSIIECQSADTKMFTERSIAYTDNSANEPNKYKRVSISASKMNQDLPITSTKKQGSVDYKQSKVVPFQINEE